MALFRPSASGLFWSLTGSWVTSSVGLTTWGPATSLPTVGDDIYLNNSTITIDIDAISSVKANLISTRALTNPPSAVGGVINCSLNHQTIVITASMIDSNSGLTFLNITGNGNNIIISSSISASSAPTNAGMIHNNGRYNIYNIIGNLINTNLNAQTSRLFSDVKSNTTLNINGNVTGSGTTNLFFPNYGPTVTINGNILGNFIFPSAVTNALFTINGNINTSGASTTNGIPLNFAAVTGIATIVNGNITAGPSASAYISTTTDHILVVRGNLTNTGSGGYTAVASARLILTGSATYNVVTSSGGAAMPFTTASNFNTSYYPAITDVRSGSAYGDGTYVSRTGSMIVPSINDVRSGSLVNTGSATGSVILPSASDIRLGTPFDTGSTGLVYIPLRSVVSQSANVDNTTGTYTGLEDFWSFATSSFTAGGAGKLIQTNLDVKVGSVSSSFLTALNDPSTTNPTVKRLQNAARVQDMGDQIASSSYV